MIKIFFLTLFLFSSVYTSAHTGGLASSGANKCSKTFKNSDQENAEKGGLIKRLFNRFAEEPPTVLDELNDPELKIGVFVWARPKNGYGAFGGIDYINEIGLRMHEPRKFTSYYKPVNSKNKKGFFVLVFSTNLLIKDPPPGIDGRLNIFRHIIYWRSEAKNTHLDENTVAQIFETLLEGKPDTVAQETYNRLAFDPYGHEIIEPLLFRDNTDKVREAIIHAIQESSSTDTIMTSTNG